MNGIFIEPILDPGKEVQYDYLYHNLKSSKLFMESLISMYDSDKRTMDISISNPNLIKKLNSLKRTKVALIINSVNPNSYSYIRELIKLSGVFKSRLEKPVSVWDCPNLTEQEMRDGEFSIDKEFNYIGTIEHVPDSEYYKKRLEMVIFINNLLAGEYNNLIWNSNAIRIRKGSHYPIFFKKENGIFGIKPFDHEVDKIIKFERFHNNKGACLFFNELNEHLIKYKQPHEIMRVNGPYVELNDCEVDPDHIDDNACFMFSKWLVMKKLTDDEIKSLYEPYRKTIM